jgi:hypothetical protein
MTSGMHDVILVVGIWALVAVVVAAGDHLAAAATRWLRRR